MKITLLGTGTPFPDPTRQGSALLIEIADERILFDAGRGAGLQLARAGKTAASIGHIFITHHHFDHIGDLGPLMLDAWHGGRSEPLRIFGPPGTSAIVAALLDQVYKRHIDFRHKQATAAGRTVVDLHELVAAQDYEAGLIQATPGWRVHAADVEHGHRLGLARAAWPCFGYRLESAGKIVAISGDTVVCEGIDRLARGADILIQCCYLAEQEVIGPDMELLARDIIATAGQAGQIAARAGVRKLVLTHFDRKPDDVLRAMLADVRRHYDGDVCLAEDLMTIDV
jgi:ribonuclease BN (tRNA processing enzyme)